MVDIKALELYLEHLKTQIAAINSSYLVIDDSQINEIIKDVKQSENLILLGLIPSHNLEGEHEDNVMDKDQMALLVLKKVDRKVRHGEFINNLHSCQVVARELRTRLIMDMTEYNDGCSFLNQLNVPSITVDPVWSLAGCDGYEINFSLRSAV